MPRNLTDASALGGDQIGTATEAGLASAYVTGHVNTSPPVGRQWPMSNFIFKNASGHVGIGTASPAVRCHVQDSAAITSLRIETTNASVSVGNYAELALADVGAVRAWFRSIRDGSGETQIGYNSQIVFKSDAGGTPTERLRINGSHHILPGGDNTQDLGSGAKRMRVIYAGTGTINTSDERAKAEVSDIPDEWLDAWGDVQWQRFKFVDGVRWHIGLVAQAVHAAFAGHGLDAFDIGLCCYDAWEEEREPIYKSVTKTRPITVIETEEAGEDENGAPLFRLREVESVEEYEEAVDTGKTRVTLEAGDRWGLRYDECQAMEAAWNRRELSRMAARLAALEPA